MRETLNLKYHIKRKYSALDGIEKGTFLHGRLDHRGAMVVEQWDVGSGYFNLIDGENIRVHAHTELQWK